MRGSYATLEEVREMLAKPKRSKYGAVRTPVDGHKFASKAEANRYAELKLLERAGLLTTLVLQHRLPLVALGGQAIGDYVADFTYFDEKGEWTIEDVKGVRTALFAWKARHVAAQYGRKIVEVK